MNAPILNPTDFTGSDYDIDGPRGADPYYPQMTTVGADEIIAKVSGISSIPNQI